MRAGPARVKAHAAEPATGDRVPAGPRKAAAPEKWPRRMCRGSVRRMKALIGTVLFCALVAGALCWPVNGRSFWQRAGDRGLPRAAAQVAARGVRSAWSAIFHRAEPEPSAHAPLRPSPRKETARKSVAAAHLAQGTAIPVHVAGLGAPEAAPAGPDRIVAQPPRERLQQDDRAGLEKLLRAR